MIIGIGGVSNAGKTTLASRLKEQLPNLNVSILSQDDFPNPVEEIPMIKDHVDWEVPISIDIPGYLRQVLEDAKKHDLVIAEGLFAFCDERIVRHYDKKIFLTISKPTFLERKSNDFRWGKEPEWYMEHIWDSHLKCGKQNVSDKDTLILSGEDPINLDELMPRLEIEKHFSHILS
jgi:uridine kinase